MQFIRSGDTHLILFDFFRLANQAGHYWPDTVLTSSGNDMCPKNLPIV